MANDEIMSSKMQNSKEGKCFRSEPLEANVSITLRHQRRIPKEQIPNQLHNMFLPQLEIFVEHVKDVTDVNHVT